MKFSSVVVMVFLMSLSFIFLNNHANARTTEGDEQRRDQLGREMLDVQQRRGMAAGILRSVLDEKESPEQQQRAAELKASITRYDQKIQQLTEQLAALDRKPVTNDGGGVAQAPKAAVTAVAINKGRYAKLRDEILNITGAQKLILLIPGANKKTPAYLNLERKKNKLRLEQFCLVNVGHRKCGGSGEVEAKEEEDASEPEVEPVPTPIPTPTPVAPPAAGPEENECILFRPMTLDKDQAFTALKVMPKPTSTCTSPSGVCIINAKCKINGKIIFTPLMCNTVNGGACPSATACLKAQIANSDYSTVPIPVNEDGTEAPSETAPRPLGRSHTR